ncbi:Phthalate 4,5-dioxygenase oxygenase subunit [compost metagenome]
MWLTMGPIADRSHDRLGASDLAIVEFRKQMLEAVKAFRDGGEAIGTGANATPLDVCAFQAVVPKTEDWRTFGVTYVWPDGTQRPELEPSYSVKA